MCDRGKSHILLEELPSGLPLMGNSNRGNRGITRGGESQSEGIGDDGCTCSSDEVPVMGMERRGAAYVRALETSGGRGLIKPRRVEGKTDLTIEEGASRRNGVRVNG